MSECGYGPEHGSQPWSWQYPEAPHADVLHALRQVPPARLREDAPDAAAVRHGGVPAVQLLPARHRSRAAGV